MSSAASERTFKPGRAAVDDGGTIRDVRELIMSGPR